MNLIRTKLRIPPMRREHVSRPRLHGLLNAGLESKLTLISAPAGFGKTTLLCDWLRTQDCPVAWLSLDEHDNHWPRFLAYFLASLQTLDPTVGTGLLGSLESAQHPPIDTFLSALPAEIGAIDGPFIIVLDDFHVIVDQQVHDLLTYVVDNQPAGMHLVLSGRSDPSWPVGRLRAAGVLAEVRAADLRFTLAEATTLLNDTLDLRLTEQELSTLEERTEGWVAGLHLAALSLKNAPDRHAFVEAFAGSDRFVLDYLMEEVLSQQPDEIRSFLLETSLLDRFNASLCDQVTGRSDSQAMLRRLEAGNLFVVPLDNERLWYAYHALMRSFLRSIQKERDPSRVAALHLRASQWYEANGDIVDAIQHALAAENHERIGQLLQSNGLALAFQGELSTLLTWLHTFRESWLQAGPWLRIAQLWAHSFSAEASTIGPELEQTRALVEEGLRALGEEPSAPRADSLRHALAHLTAIEANLAVMDGRHEEAIRLSRQALASLPYDDPVARRYSSVCLGMGLRNQGNLQAAADVLAQADSSPGQSDQAPARGLATLAGVQIWMGRLDEAEDTCRRMIAIHDDYLRRCGRRLPITTFGYARLSSILLERNQVEQAVHYARESRLLAGQWQQTDALFESHVHYAQALAACGEGEAALAEMARLQRAIRDRSPWFFGLARAHEARLCLRMAQDARCLERARQWAAETGIDRDRPLEFQNHVQYQTLAALLLHEGRGDRSQAVAGQRLVRRFLDLLGPTGAKGLALQAKVLLAMFEEVIGRIDQALDALADCLRTGEAQGYIRVFIEHGPPMQSLLERVVGRDGPDHYTEALLASFGGVAEPEPGPTPASGRLAAMEEPLSERELDVLRLLATTLASADIADQLCVAISTVRSHTKAIYGKLGVHNRLEAVDRAREIGLI